MGYHLASHSGLTDANTCADRQERQTDSRSVWQGAVYEDMYEGGMKELETIDNFWDWNSRPPFHYLRNLFNLVLMSLGNADNIVQYSIPHPTTEMHSTLKVHKIEIFFGFDFEICIISLLVMSKY